MSRTSAIAGLLLLGLAASGCATTQQSLHGPAAWDVVRQLFRPRSGGQLPPTPGPGQFWLGRLIDDVILAFKAYDHVELHCHGGVAIVRLIEEQFAALGVRVVGWRDFVSHLEQMLAHAPTRRTASILLDQYAGAWDKRDRASVQRLRDLMPLWRLPDSRSIAWDRTPGVIARPTLVSSPAVGDDSSTLAMLLTAL